MAKFKCKTNIIKPIYLFVWNYWCNFAQYKGCVHTHSSIYIRYKTQ